MLAGYASNSSLSTTYSNVSMTGYTDMPDLYMYTSQTQTQLMEIDNDDDPHHGFRRIRWLKKPPVVRYTVIPKII